MDEAEIKNIKRRIRRRWKVGMSDLRIAQDIGRSRAFVAKLRRQMGLKVVCAKRFNDDQLRALHAEGHSDAEMAEALSVAKPTVVLRRKTLGLVPNRAKGVQRRPPGPTGFAEVDLRALHAEGLTDAEMADRLDVSSSNVAHWRRRFGLAPNMAPSPVEMLTPEQDMLRRAARCAFSITPQNPALLTLLEPVLAKEMRKASA